MKKFYVYAHIDPLTSRAFYIGKGTGPRATRYESRNPAWRLYVKEHLEAAGLTYGVEILAVCASEDEALERETAEIHRRLGAGELLLNRVVPPRVQPEVEISALRDEFSMPNSAESIAAFVRRKRKEASLTQRVFADVAGVGLRFVRELEAGKETLRADKVNQVLSLFGSCLVPYLRN